MSDQVVFEEENRRNVVGNIAIVPGPAKGMLAWMIKSKMVKTAKQAEWLLLAVAIIILIIAAAIYIYSQNNVHQYTASEIKASLIETQAPNITPASI